MTTTKQETWFVDSFKMKQNVSKSALLIISKDLRTREGLGLLSSDRRSQRDSKLHVASLF